MFPHLNRYTLSSKNFRECEILLEGYKIDILELKRIINNPNQQKFIKTSGLNHFHIHVGNVYKGIKKAVILIQF